MWKLGSGIRLRHSSHMSDFAEVDCFTFCYFPPTVSSRTALLGKLQQHKGSSSICLHQTKLGTTSWPEVCTLRATQLALSVPLIPIGVGLCVVVLNRAFAEKSKRQNCLFLLVCALTPFFHCWQPVPLLREPRSAKTSWLQSCVEAIHIWSLQLWDHLRLWYGVSSQHHSTLQLPLYRCHEFTSTLLPHHSAPSEGWVTSELNQKR